MEIATDELIPLFTTEFLDVAKDSHIVDADGIFIRKGIWSTAKRAMPKIYLGDNDLRWFISWSIWADWVEILNDRTTVICCPPRNSQSGIEPFGTKVICIPDDVYDKPFLFLMNPKQLTEMNTEAIVSCINIKTGIYE